MQVMILCGGLGTRLREETEHRPKPMVEIAGKPILWHIMSYFATYGLKDFILPLGYRGDVVRDYFLNLKVRTQDFTLDLDSGAVNRHGPDACAGWKVTLAETGYASLTGSRVKQAARYLSGERFMLTYGDGLSDVPLDALLEFHRAHGKLATLTAVHPPTRFGELTLDGARVAHFSEKPSLTRSFISGGFFVFERGVLDYLSEAEGCALEQEPLEALARGGQLMAYRHEGFFQCMDTYRDWLYLNELWSRGERPWARWERQGG